MAHVFIYLFCNLFCVFTSNRYCTIHLTHYFFLIFSLTDFYPPVEKIVEQCGKFRLLDRLLEQLFARKHKVCFQLLVHMYSHLLLSCLLIFHYICYQVLIFSQWTKVLDIMHYYFIEKGHEVCRIDGNVKLDERRRQVLCFFKFYENLKPSYIYS
jgi:SNF2 family DNA or RNA helicase